MKSLHRLLFVGLAACLASGFASHAAADNSHPSLYSFNDIYRLTVNGPALPPTGASLAGAEAGQVRVANVQAAAAPGASELRFTITQVPGPGRWPLILAGLAAAAWVAHRRLTRPL